MKKTERLELKKQQLERLREYEKQQLEKNKKKNGNNNS